MGSLRAIRCVVSLALIGVGGAGCGNEPSRDQCTQLFDHLIDLEIKAGGATSGALTPEMKEDLEAQRKQVTEATRDKFVSTCTSSTPKRVVVCQIDARDIPEVQKCE